ncbi:hypothetical protein DIE23_15520 [Burkholderia sp. Bp9143]|uniref:hypothetical protein n=1 Tax=Burkholderia sp. Bp9143 TaxID=2184574 RepID=UPI000F59A17E|nr:hypothetical protein [Burkholderia sp. Bp9143]RQR32732.1 hypothetical protein DIE23_15520 [Burkholderia sp. Bp9143]
MSKRILFENTLARHVATGQPRLPGAANDSASTPASSYAKLLEGPVSKIAGNVPERADATSVAILGYN